MLIWIIVAVVLVILEVLTQMVWALCLAIGCLGAVIATACGLPLVWQLIILGVTSILAFAILMPRVKHWQKRQEHKEGRQGKTGMEALLGRRAVVTNEIRPGHMGRVRIDGDNWQAIAPGTDYVIHAGAETVVTAYDSIILTVTPAVHPEGNA